MAEKAEMVGKKFGRLTVVEEIGQNKHGQFMWRCICECGTTNVICGNSLRSGRTKSCGCLQKETSRILGLTANKKHGMYGTAAYRTWDGIIQRCNNPNSMGYKDYGGRGIKVCDRWLDFINFFEDMGERPKGLTIERKNNELGYFKENCYYASSTVQARNRRIIKTNKTGVAGVGWCKKSNKYFVRIMSDDKRIYLGCFADLKDALGARKQAELKYWE